MTMQWEYLFVDLPKGWLTTANSGKWNKRLNELGTQGWELVSLLTTTCMTLGGGSKTDEIVAVLKRSSG